MGFPQDYWSDEYLQSAIGSFGKLISWDDNKRRLTRVILRAKVVDLPSVPHFIIFSDTEGLENESWTVQCEILQRHLPGGGPLVEAPISGENEIGNAPCQFFGLGQQVIAQVPDLNQAQLPDLNQAQQPDQDQHQNARWEQRPTQQQQLPQIDVPVNQPQPVILQLEEPTSMQIDLNQPDEQHEQMDLQEVINNPIQPQPDEDFIDLVHHADLNVQIPQAGLEVQIPQLPGNNAEAELLELADELQEQQHQNLGINLQQQEPNLEMLKPWLDEEIPLDQLVAPRDMEGQPLLDQLEDPQDAVNLNLDVGRVIIPELSGDPAFLDYTRMKTAEAVRLWAHLLAPGTNSGIQIKIPEIWSRSFTVFLLSTNTFEWAKSFAESDAMRLLHTNDGAVLFSIPKECPTEKLCCNTPKQSSSVTLSPLEEEEPIDKAAKTARKRITRKGSPMVETEVRRSPRLKEVRKGFKSNVCFNKRCLSCAPDPPTLSVQVIKKLAVDFCKVDEALVSEENLSAKRSKLDVEIIRKKESKARSAVKEGTDEANTENNDSDNEEADI